MYANYLFEAPTCKYIIHIYSEKLNYSNYSIVISFRICKLVLIHPFSAIWCPAITWDFVLIIFEIKFVVISELKPRNFALIFHFHLNNK